MSPHSFVSLPPALSMDSQLQSAMKSPVVAVVLLALLMPLLPPTVAVAAASLSFSVRGGDGRAAVSIDLHIPVLGQSYASVLQANAFLNAHLGSSEIDFQHKDIPHITLYLTSFSCPNVPPPPPPLSPARPGTSIVSVDASEGNSPPPLTCVGMITSPVSDALSTLPLPCSITLSNPYAAGTFAMMNVTNSACLQRYSDAIVNATHKFSQPNQTTPAWVNSLPEPERSEKLRLIQEYGSPNVFGQFAPHVTLAWSADGTAVYAAVAALRIRPSAFDGQVFALGSVGDHGTVLQGKDLAIYNTSDHNDACKRAHSTPASCDEDKTTQGGCVWCDVVDAPPFCTSTHNARSFPPPPQGRPFQCDWDAASRRATAAAVVRNRGYGAAAPWAAPAGR